MRHGTPLLAVLLAAAALYAALALALTSPLAAELGTAIPSDLGDAVLNTWILWWNTQATPLTEAWWRAPMFFPAQGAIAFSEHLLGLSPLTTTVQWLGGSPLVAHNLAMLLAFPLCALAAHALAFSLTRRHDAALLAGLAFGFSPYWMAHLPQVQVLSAYGMPLALLGLHRYLRTPAWRWLAMFGAAWLFQALTCVYYLFFFPVLLGLWMLWFTPPWRRPREFAWIATAFVAASLPLVPVLAGYRTVQQAFGLFRGREEILAFSADLTSLLDASPLLWLWRSPLAFHRPEGELFPGVTVVILVVAGLAVTWRALSGLEAPRRLRLALLIVAAAGALVTLLALALGRIDTSVGGLRVVVAGPDRPALLMSLALAAWCATSARARQAYRDADPLVFYALATVILWLFALGPTPRVLGHRFWQAGPYALLMELPGFDAIRVPARFAAIATLCLAVGAGLAADRLVPRGRRWRRPAMGLLALAIVAEGWITRMPLVPVPSAMTLGDLAPRAVLELPMGGAGEDLSAMFRAMSHRVPLVNGYSGYEPSHYTALRMAFEARDPRVFDELAASAGPLAIAIDRRADPDGAWLRFVGAHGGARLVRQEAEHVLYALHGAERVSPLAARALAVAGVSSNRRATFAPALADGRRDSVWSTEAPQDGTEEVVADLGSVDTVVGVRLWLGRLVTHAPRALRIDTSADGRQWSTAWEGPTGALIYRDALEDERQVPLRIDIPQQQARYVRLRQVGRSADAPWSMGELEVLGPAPEARSAGAGSR